jgi:HK97 family phage major capsid protein/HK97 family phage prohead protease
MQYAARTAPPPGGEPLEFVLSDNSVDRVGDVVEQNWELAHFRDQPIALFNHDRDSIIGTWKDVRVEGNRLIGKLVPAAAGTNPLVDSVRSLLEQKILRAVSVGFRVLKKELLNDKADEYFGPFRFIKSELLEASLVAVPANPNAVQLARSMKLSPDIASVVFSKPAAEHATVPRANPGKSAVPLAPKKDAKMLTLSQKIQASQKRINDLRDKLTELESKADQTAEEKDLSDEIPAILEAEEKELVSLERKEKALAPRPGNGHSTKAEFSSAPLTGEVLSPNDHHRAFALPKKKIEAADYVFRAMAVGIRSFGAQVPLEQAMREMYGNDEATQIILRAAVNPANTTVAGYAAELVQTGFGAFIDRIIANSLYEPVASLGGRFDLGRNGSLKIPTRTTTAKASGAWVGEGSPKPVKKISLAPVTLTPHKLAVITTFTEEMAFYSVPAIEGVLQKAMLDDTREALDGFLIDNVASSTSRPAGLLNGVTPITAASSGTTIEKIVTDINALIAPMEAVGGGTKVVLMMNPAQARRLGMAQTTTGDFAFGDINQAQSKFGVSRIVVSTTITAGTVIAVDADWFATVTGDTPRFAVSNEATLHEEDTTPLAIGTPGAPATIAAPVRSLFQTDSMAIRLSIYVTWGMLRTGMVQTVNSVGW